MAEAVGSKEKNFNHRGHRGARSKANVWDWCGMWDADQREGRVPSRQPVGRRRLRTTSLGEPSQEAALEFLWRGADGAAVVGVGNLPDLRAWSAGANEARVANGDVAVDLAVN